MNRLFTLAIVVFVMALGLSACGHLTEDNGLLFRTADEGLTIGFRLLPPPPPLPTVTPDVVPPTPDPCTLVRGNIDRNGRKLYHLPGMPNFNQVQPEMCFVTEQDAIDAGFAKAGN